MKRAALVGWLLVGCGSAPLAPLRIVNESTYAEQFALDILSATADVAGDDIALDGWRLTMREHVGGGCAGDAGCTNVGLRTINAPFPHPDELGWTPETMRATIAGVLCHELGHAYFYESIGNSDHDHAHNAVWFDYNAPGSVCYEVATRFAR